MSKKSSTFAAVFAAEKQAEQRKIQQMNEFLEKEEAILKMLKTVFDPEIPVNVYDLGLIYGIELKDDSVSTAEGISIGDAKDKVRKAYGEPSSSADTSDVFTKGGSKLSVIYGSDGNVSSIVYDLNK